MCEAYRYEYESNTLLVLSNSKAIWFNAIDTAVCLGYSNPQSAIDNYVSMFDTKTLLELGLTIDDQSHNTQYINKKGLNTLVNNSSSWSTIEFESWIEGTVISDMNKIISQNAINKLDEENQLLRKKVKNLLLKLHNNKNPKNDILCVYSGGDNLYNVYSKRVNWDDWDDDFTIEPLLEIKCTDASVVKNILVKKLVLAKKNVNDEYFYNINYDKFVSIIKSIISFVDTVDYSLDDLELSDESDE